MSKFCILILSLFIAHAVSAQGLIFKWGKSFDPRNSFSGVYNNGRTIGIDENGNVYSAGLFSRTADFDPGVGEFTMTASSHYGDAIYVSKLDANGNFIWARQIPVLVEFADIELKVDKAGNVYLASYFSEVADMDPGASVLMMSPMGYKNAFVLKLDTNGNLIWVKQFGGQGDAGSEATAIELDKDNNVIVCGFFSRTMDFDPGAGQYNMTSTAHSQAFIVKLTTNGDFVWAKQFGNSSVIYKGAGIHDVKADLNGNIVLVGGFSGTCDFDPGAAVFTLSGLGIEDGFIAKLTTDGNFVWAKCITNTGSDPNYHVRSLAVDIDSRNNIVMTGYFSGTFDFDPGLGINNITSHSRDCYILKLNEEGNFLWVKNIPGQGHDLVLDISDNIYIAGIFYSSTDLDPGPGVHTVPSSYFGASVIMKFNSGGSFVSAVEFPGASFFRRMVIDASLNIHVTGFVSGPDDFDPGTGVYLVGGGADQYPFVLKLGPCPNKTTSALSITACDSYILNNEIYNSSGTYSQTISNSVGCDSIITLNLTISKSTTEQTKIICEPEFFYAGGANRFVSGTFMDTLQNALGCDSIVTTHLTVRPRPLPVLGPDRKLCADTKLIVTPGTFANYLWQDGSDEGNITISSEGTYWVTVTNEFGCIATDTLVIPGMLESPSNFLKEVDSICSYGNLRISPSGYYSSYQWSDGYTGRELVIRNPGFYALTVTDANGCSSSDTITVVGKNCRQGFSIPTAFTPNGDGKNDYFKPLLFGDVQQYRFAIYNRWGAMIFETSDPNNGWDGKIGGQAQPTGTYVWSCYYQLQGSPPQTEKGTVTIIR